MFEYRRYLGKPTTVAGHDIKERTVFGFAPSSFVLPGVGAPISATEEDIEKLTRQSRPFKADPATLFNFKVEEAPVKVAKPKPVPAVKPKKVMGAEILEPGTNGGMPTIKVDGKIFRPTPGGLTIEDAPDEVPVEPEVKPDREDETYQTEKHGDMLAEEYDNEVPDSVRSRIEKELNHNYSKPAIRFNSGIMMGGSANNYKAIKLTPFGGTALEVESISSNPKYRLSDVPTVDAPDYVFRDFKDNVAHALGLQVELPFQRLAFGLTNQGTMIATRRISGLLYGIILVDGKQLERLMGGFNSRTMAQAITHELAHFIDNTMLRNVERMKWQAALRGKQLHPDQASMGAKTTDQEHFATLAELMVWGNSLRRVYNLNGFEIVNRYFKNRFIPESMIDEQKA